MKTLQILFISMICYSTQAQQWFDNSCKNIDESVSTESFKTSQTRNILKVTINQAGVIELNEEPKPNISEIGFKEWVLNYITNPDSDRNKADKPEKIFVQLISFNDDPKTLETLKSYVQDVYLYLWDKKAEDKYASTYIDLNCKKRSKIFDDFPLRILPNLEKKPKKKKPNRIGVPTFGGDVIDN